MKWVELRLGRVPHLLAWHELDRIAHHALIARGFTVVRSRLTDESFDPIVGILMLRAGVPELRALTKMPDTLEKLGLPAASMALMYALGHEDRVAEMINDADDGLKSFFATWRDQPAAEELPERPVLYTTQTVEFESTVAGCHISVNARNEPPCVELAESVLASIEALLATVLIDGAVAREPELAVTVQMSDFSPHPFSFEVRDVAGKPEIEIRCRAFSPHTLSIEEQHHLKERLFEVIAHVCGRILMLSDPESLFTKLFRDDLASQRAMDFTTSFVVVGNTLGHEPKTMLDLWISDESATYDLRREGQWDAGMERLRTRATRPEPTPAPPDAQVPPTLGNFSNVPHQQMRTFSLIRESLWDQARWKGVGFAVAPHASLPPIMALLFEDPTAGTQIFEGWRSELSRADDSNRLRVVIIRKISQSNPKWYRIVIGSEPTSILKQENITHLATVSRIQTMTPTSSENLNRFLAGFAKYGSYVLAPGRQRDNEMEFAEELGVHKRQLIVRDAWEVGPHDLESVAVFDDDDVIVPQGANNPPYAQIRKRRAAGH